MIPGKFVESLVIVVCCINIYNSGKFLDLILGFVDAEQQLFNQDLPSFPGPLLRVLSRACCLTYRSYWKYNFLMTPYVRPLVSQSLCYAFLKGLEV